MFKNTWNLPSDNGKTVGTEKRSVLAKDWRWGRGRTTKGYKGAFWGGGGNILFLDCGGGNRTICFSKFIVLNTDRWILLDVNITSVNLT